MGKSKAAAKSESTDTAPTPFISIAAHYWGTGTSLKEARAAMLKAGASAQELAMVFQLPDGAHSASSTEGGAIIWHGAEGEVTAIAKYMNGKPVRFEANEPSPAAVVAAEKAEAAKAAKPKRSRKSGSKAKEEPEANADLEDKLGHALGESADSEPQSGIEGWAVAEANGELEPGHVDPVTGGDVIGAADEDGVARSIEPADYLLFVGSNFYSKDEFIKESAELGISRRMPSHKLPKSLVMGSSRVFVAAAGQRKAGSEDNSSEVFGYFRPQAVEFIAGEKPGKEFATIIAELQLRPDSRIISSIKGEAERGCGKRKVGGTYIVVDKADSPLTLLGQPAKFTGNHFRGLMKLSAEQAAAFTSGGEVATLVTCNCMRCGKPFKCAPDGASRQAREERRMAKGLEPKWLNKCGVCRSDDAKARAAERRAANPETVEGPNGGSEVESAN